MLYRTTRGKHDVVTAFKTVHTDCYGDGGLFLPFRMPKLNRSRIETMAASSATQIIADVLDELFSCDLTAWDVELAIGRTPLRTAKVGRGVVAGEFWHAPGQDTDALVQALSDRIGGYGNEPSNWMQIAVRIALLFAVYGKLFSAGALRASKKPDIAVSVGDFSMPMAAWYAREMGLPIGNILCGCNANGAFWDLLNRGEMPTGERLVHTCTPQASFAVPRNLERLIHGALGVDENKRFLRCCQAGETYVLPPEQAQVLRNGLFAAVISDSRIATIIPAVYRSGNYILGPYAALAYGCLQDFRATTGEENQTLLICERAAVQDGALIARLLKIKPSDLEKRTAR